MPYKRDPSVSRTCEGAEQLARIPRARSHEDESPERRFQQCYNAQEAVDRPDGDNQVVVGDRR